MAIVKFSKVIKLLNANFNDKTWWCQAKMASNNYKVVMFINLKKLKIQILSLKRKRKSESLLKIYELHLKMDNYPRMYFHLTFSMLKLWTPYIWAMMEQLNYTFKLTIQQSI